MQYFSRQLPVTIGDTAATACRWWLAAPKTQAPLPIARLPAPWCCQAQQGDLQPAGEGWVPALSPAERQGRGQRGPSAPPAFPPGSAAAERPVGDFSISSRILEGALPPAGAGPGGTGRQPPPHPHRIRALMGGGGRQAGRGGFGRGVAAPENRQRRGPGKGCGLLKCSPRRSCSLTV